MSPTAVLSLTGLLVLSAPCLPAGFNDIFASDPGELTRKPFMWWIPAADPAGPASWEIVDGALQYRCAGAVLAPATLSHFDAGVDMHDDSTWTLETAFRHISGTPPLSQYETVIYVRWAADTPGHIGLLCLCYDASRKQLDFLNGDGKQDPIPADLTGEFHRVRLAVRDRQVTVYVDGRPAAGPYALRSLKWEGPAQFILGPITVAQPHDLICRWDYLAYTDQGALAPGEGGWDPSADTEPVGIPHDLGGPAPEDPEAFAKHPPYDNIRVLSRDRGTEAYDRALPEHVRLWQAAAAERPARMTPDCYTYPDTGGPVLQNFYRGTFPSKSEDGRCVAIFHITRGTGDTIFGFSDYKVWYCVSTDGGKTWGQEKPLVQDGPQYSPQHPNRYVQVGKNGFVFATLQPFIYSLSNGKLLLPCYYGPLDEHGEYYNPLSTSTYSQVFCLTGTWNEARDDLTWEATDPITLGTDKSTSGLSECAIIELEDKPGHILMVIRAGNEGDHTGTVPSWKWKTLSTDYGRTWSELSPFTFSDGSRFWSPTAQSNLIRSSRTGKVYWIGNISRVRPRSGWPRYPLVIAELDEERLGLRQETVTVIDDRGPQDGSNMQLSNFDFLEDAATGNIIVRLNRFNGGPGADGLHTYVIQVK